MEEDPYSILAYQIFDRIESVDVVINCLILMNSHRQSNHEQNHLLICIQNLSTADNQRNLSKFLEVLLYFETIVQLSSDGRKLECYPDLNT